MNNKLTYISEPKLKFAYGQSTEDCRDGLTLFGPYTSTRGSIRVGVVERRTSYKAQFVRQSQQLQL